MNRCGYAIGLLCLTLGILTSCVSPIDVQMQKSASLQACEYKFYYLDTPVDITPRQWLSGPGNRQALEAVMLAQMNAIGLQQVAASQQPPLRLHYELFGKDERATSQEFSEPHPLKSGETVAASDFNLGVLTMTLFDTNTGVAVYKVLVKLVVGSLRDQNLDNARQGLAKGFGAFPVCNKGAAQ